MPALPALISRPATVLPPPAAPDPRVEPDRLVQQDLGSGLPARIGLDPTRSLVLGVPLGVVRPVLAADPLAVVFDTAVLTDPDEARETGDAWPRLTLVLGGTLGQTVPVVAGVRFVLAAGGVAVVAVTVDRLRVTAGSLRSPGRFGGLIALRWRDLTSAADSGPPAVLGDTSIPRSFQPEEP